jgi:hypothetical protein
MTRKSDRVEVLEEGPTTAIDSSNNSNLHKL